MENIREKAVWRLIPWLATSGGLTWLAREFLFEGPLAQDVEAWGVFFSVFGILYAIVLGFVIMQALERLSLLKQTIDSEINALQDVRDFTIYLDDQEETRREIWRELLVYVRSVVEQEWAEMRHPSRKCDDDTSPELENLMRATNKISAANESDRVALSAIIGHIGEITTFRTRRICTAQEHTEKQLVYLLEFMSYVLVGGLILTVVQSVFVHYMMVLSTVIAVYFSLKILKDLDHPLSGDWKVGPSPFQKLTSSLEKLISSHGLND
jgi:hypothetical protein